MTRIADDVMWRKEKGYLLILSREKKLLVFPSPVGTMISPEGEIQEAESVGQEGTLAMFRRLGLLAED
jgi:hypothetical protein